MARILTFSILALIALVGIYGTQHSPNEDNFRSGDIIFISSSSGQGKAIQLATKSKYSHVGILFKEGDETWVYHAVEPVKKSMLSEFLTYSNDGQYVVKRLKVPLQDESVMNTMLKEAKQLLGKHYDIYFNWSDDEWYCSEYVWKLYKHATDLEIGRLRPLKDFDLSSPEVNYIMKKRYGNKIPYNEKMISPGDMFNSDLLQEVKY